MLKFANRFLVLLLTLCVAFLPSCHQKQEGDHNQVPDEKDPVTFTDALGREVTVKKQRIFPKGKIRPK